MPDQKPMTSNSSGAAYNETVLASAITNARQTFDAVCASIPQTLKGREERLHDQYLRHKGNALTKLGVLFEFMRELYNTFEKLTPCQKGCSACCHYPVSISELEVQFIERGTGVRRMKSYGAPKQWHGTPCQFLRNGACSIYAYRPFMCRRHVVFTKTSYWCQTTRANAEAFTYAKFSEVDRVFASLVAETADTRFHDIREIFRG
jgi:Fe-S-cluster containining protein